MKDVFESLDEIKTQIKDRVLSNQNILKLIHYGTGDPLSQDDILDLSMIVNKKIYFQPKTFETIKDQIAFMTLNVNGMPEFGGGQISKVDFSFMVFTHLENFELEDGSTRAWKVCSELNKLFTDTKGTWIGKVEMEGFYEVSEVPNNYYCVSIRFSVSEFKA